MNFYTFSLCSVLSLLISAFGLDAKEVSSMTDGIFITADAAVQANGKTHITFSIENRSPYSLASGHPRSSSDFYCFQFRLKDKAGNYVMQDSTWARDHAQMNEHAEYVSMHPGGLISVTIPQGEKRESQFDLEDAYGERASSGKVLEVYWKNWWNQPVEVWERKGPDGKIIPARVEPNHFPGARTFSVSLPLPKKAGDDQTSAESANETTAAPQQPIRPEMDASKPRSVAANTNTESPAASSGWWWAFLAIPLVFVIYLGLRLWKR